MESHEMPLPISVPQNTAEAISREDSTAYGQAVTLGKQMAQLHSMRTLSSIHRYDYDKDRALLQTNLAPRQEGDINQMANNMNKIPDAPSSKEELTDGVLTSYRLVARIVGALHLSEARANQMLAESDQTGWPVIGEIFDRPEDLREIRAMLLPGEDGSPSQFDILSLNAARLTGRDQMCHTNLAVLNRVLSLEETAHLGIEGLVPAGNIGDVEQTYAATNGWLKEQAQRGASFLAGAISASRAAQLRGMGRTEAVTVPQPRTGLRSILRFLKPKTVIEQRPVSPLYRFDLSKPQAPTGSTISGQTTGK